MGSSQSSKTYVKSPVMELEKLRLVNGSVKEGPVRPVRPAGAPKPSSRGKGSVGEGNGVEPERQIRKKASNSSSVDGKNDGLMKKGVEDELVDGWPKWLVDNIPSDVLKNIVPKSADSYTKIDKVNILCTSKHFHFLNFGL